MGVVLLFMRLCSPFKPGGLLSACLRDRRIERPCLLALVILVEDLCGRVSACYNEGMVTPVIARRFLSTNKHTARGTVWKTVGLDCNDKHAHVPTAIQRLFTIGCLHLLADEGFCIS